MWTYIHVETTIFIKHIHTPKKIKGAPHGVVLRAPQSGPDNYVSGKKINLENSNYWNVELQEAYYSYKEAYKKREMKFKK